MMVVVSVGREEWDKHATYPYMGVRGNKNHLVIRFQRQEACIFSGDTSRPMTSCLGVVAPHHFIVR